MTGCKALKHCLASLDNIDNVIVYVQVNERLVGKAEAHSDWWYDPRAILSRKPSVRFRRSANIMRPFYDEDTVRCVCSNLWYESVRRQSAAGVQG
jgi:hypothetical protein